jgi:hypothetical protein
MRAHGKSSGLSVTMGPVRGGEALGDPDGQGILTKEVAFGQHE